MKEIDKYKKELPTKPPQSSALSMIFFFNLLLTKSDTGKKKQSLQQYLGN